MLRILEVNIKKTQKKYCKELFEDWLTTNSSAKPKIWKNLLDIVFYNVKLCNTVVVLISRLMHGVTSSGETAQVNAILDIVFEYIVIYC